MRLLVVEDEPKVAKSLREGLESEGYEVVVEGTGDAGFRRGRTERFDLILLDLGLPGMGGLEILTALREEGVETPVLVLTARDAVGDRVNGPEHRSGTTTWSSRSRSPSCWRGFEPSRGEAA